MAKYEGQVENAGSPHMDYSKNLKSAYNFIDKMKPKMPNGMSVSVRDSENLPKSLLLFAFSPIPSEKCGRFSHAVQLHDSFYEVRGRVGRCWQMFTEIANKNKEFVNDYWNFRGEDSKDCCLQKRKHTIPSLQAIRLQG